MTLVQLANFIRIAEFQSLSKAAAVARIAQPALSRQVRSLEHELGTALLYRHPWGVTLTPAGELLLARARKLLWEAERTRDAVQGLANEPGGRLALGLPASLATALLPPLAATLRRKYPAIQPHFVDGFSAHLHARALAGELDLAILYDDQMIGPLAKSPLLTEPLMLIGPSRVNVSHGPTAEMLDAKPLILPSRPNRLRLIVDAHWVPSAAYQIFEVDSLSAIIRMVEQGVGFTVLPYSSVSAEIGRGALKSWKLGDPILSRTLLLARPTDSQPTASLAAVEAEIRSLVAQLSSKHRWKPLTKTVAT